MMNGVKRIEFPLDGRCAVEMEANQGVCYCVDEPAPKRQPGEPDLAYKERWMGLLLKRTQGLIADLNRCHWMPLVHTPTKAPEQ